MQHQIREYPIRQLLTEANQAVAAGALNDARRNYAALFAHPEATAHTHARWVAEAHLGMGAICVMQGQSAAAAAEIDHASKIYLRMGDDRMSARIAMLSRVSGEAALVVLHTLQQTYAPGADDSLSLLANALKQQVYQGSHQH